MKKHINRHAIPLFVAFAIAALVFAGCLSARELPQAVAPAVNSANFIDRPPIVSPQPVIADHPFTVSLQVLNMGTAAGSYKADLYVDGNFVASKELPISPGQSASASFEVTLHDTVIHLIKIGPRTLSVAAGENRVPVTIRIDNGVVDGCDPAVGSAANPYEIVPQNDGSLIRFTAPPGGLMVNGIEIYGYIKSSTYDFDHDTVFGPGVWVYGPDIAAAAPVNPDVTVNIYGDHRNKLYTGTYSKQLFSYSPKTVTMPVPNVPVDGVFFVELVTHNMPRLNALGLVDRDLYGRYVVHTWYYQLCVGYESAVDVQSWVSDDGTALPERYLTYNWLIRTDGFQVKR
jgi:hypothetical protein